MSDLSLALPPGVDADLRRRSTSRALSRFLDTAELPAVGVRSLVIESWRRSHELNVDPTRALSPTTLDDADLAELRRAHPMRHALPIVERLLMDDATAAGMIVTLGDADGQVLWVDGDPHLRRLAERINLQPGASWREADVGTNGIGTALATGGTAQIFSQEHYAADIRTCSCVAAPVLDPITGDQLGVVNVTGGDTVAQPLTAFVVRATVAAIEAELRLRATERSAMRARHRKPTARLSVLGRDRGVLVIDGHAAELSLRHSELLFLLSTSDHGLSASDLAWRLYDHDAAEVTVRAEMSRLRKNLPSLVSPSRPYRLIGELRTDAAEVGRTLERGAHRQALALYRGPLLPRSSSPAISEQRDRLRSWLRESLIRHASADALLRYAHSPEGRDDIEIWQACLDRLPYGSPRRAEVTSALTGIDRRFGVPGPPGVPGGAGVRG